MDRRPTLTAGELLFEEFCRINSIEFQRVLEGSERTPDYQVIHNGCRCWFEIKQIDADDDFEGAVQSRKVGAHIRAKIEGARGQMRMAAKSQEPAVLLVMNNLDPLQLFGTEPTDFHAAMHGDWEVVLSRSGEYLGSRRGRNRALRPDKNQNFSGVGHLRRSRGAPSIAIYANRFASRPLGDLPAAFAVEWPN